MTTIYDSMIERFRPHTGLNTIEQAEISVLFEQGISKNDPMWLILLPVYLNQTRLTDIKESVLVAGPDKVEIDFDVLAKSITDRIQIQSSQNDTEAKLETIVAKLSADKDSTNQLINRNVIIAVLCGVLLSVFSSFIAIKRSDSYWEETVTTQKATINHLRSQVEKQRHENKTTKPRKDDSGR